MLKNVENTLLPSKIIVKNSEMKEDKKNNNQI